VVHRLAADGWNVVAAAHPAGQVLPVVACVREQTALDAAVRTALDRFGGLVQGR
jgi:NAD(P)-dependent dehydrogenase (short-subunit alcohol dehydrogenase family)